MWFTDGVTANSNTLQWVELIGIPTFEATSTVSAHITSMQNPLWRNKKKDIWKTCSKRVICRKSHAMHLSRKWSINDEWCAASEQGRNATRPGSNGTFGGNQAFHCQMPLQLFTLKWAHVLVSNVFLQPQLKEFTLWWLPCPIATALLWRQRNIWNLFFFFKELFSLCHTSLA